MEPTPFFQDYTPELQRGDGKIRRIPSLTGKTTEQVLLELGRPDVERVITLDEASDEFRCELLNWYPPDRPENQSVCFLEMSWKGKEFTTTIWFHKVAGSWRVLDTCRFRNDITF
jgi:hypothetical protein